MSLSFYIKQENLHILNVRQLVWKTKMGGMHMAVIVVYGDGNDHEVAETLLDALQEYGGAVHVQNGKIKARQKSSEHLVYETDTLPALDLPHGIVVFKSRCAHEGAAHLPDTVTAVIDPDNTDALAIVRDAQVGTLTCGMSQKDTLTYSSFLTGGAMVSLQRRITTLDGKTIEPCELKVSFDRDRGKYPLLAAVAVIFLTQGMPPDNHLQC